MINAVARDGALAMVCSLVEENSGHHVMKFHSIIYQDMYLREDFKFNDIMSTVTKTINFPVALLRHKDGFGFA